MIIEHLKTRKFNPALYDNPCIDTVNDILTVCMYTLSGVMIGYQQYNPNALKNKKNDPRSGKYYTYITNGHIAMWGLESITLNSQIIVVNEGIFDACRFHNFGIPSIACFGSYNNQLKNWLTSTGKKVYTVNDSYGYNNKLSCFTNIPLPEGRDDVGECTDEEVLQMIEWLNDDLEQNAGG